MTNAPPSTTAAKSSVSPAPTDGRPVAVVVDVNDQTESWNLGCLADNGAFGYSLKFGHAGDTGTLKAWLPGCEGRNSKWSAFHEPQHRHGPDPRLAARASNAALAAY